MINKKRLIDSGYKKYKSYIKLDANCLYHKPIRSERGMRYFITLFEYSVPGNGAVYDLDLLFTLPDGRDLKLQLKLDRDDTIEKVEALIEHMFVTLKCQDFEIESMFDTELYAAAS